jgi:putative spermidine/putrescine transport system permease protein
MGDAAMRARLWLAVPALAVVILFFVIPYLNLATISFYQSSHRAAYIRQLTLGNYRAIILDRFTWQVVWHTFWIGALTTAVTLLLGYPLAYHLARASSRTKGLLIMLVISPLLVGVLIRTYGWMIVLADTGLINQLVQRLHGPELQLMYNDLGVIVGLVHVYIPFMVLSLTGSIQAIDPDLERASHSLGAGGWRTFWRITWPLSLPGVVSGVVLVFVLAESSYVIPSLLGGFTVLTVPILVIRTITELFNWPAGSAFALLFFAITLGVVWAFLELTRRPLQRLQ